jgi:hypothetical protein
MTTKRTTKPENAPAPEKRDENTDKPVTELAEVQNPETLTKDDIEEISGDDGSKDFDGTPNRDVAEALKQDKEEAKADAKAAKKGEEVTHFNPHAQHSHGPGGDIG